MFGLFSKKWNPDGKHVYITGGSSGLGLSLARIFAQKGASVSIVARTQSKLDAAIKSLEQLRVSPLQKFNAYSYALATGSEAVAALEAVCAPYGGDMPDAVINCAGSAKPMFIVDMEEADLVNGMANAYWVQAYTAWAAAKKMVKTHKKGKIVLVSSILGYMSIPGYASYTPGKHALRGLADTLHSELVLYEIETQIYFPSTIYTPGYDEENKTKPEITKKIEEGDEGITPDQAAQALYKGMVNGTVHITSDFISSLLRASTRGAAPRGNWFLEGLYDMVAYIAIPIFRGSMDRRVKAHRAEHEAYLSQKGFFE